MTKEETNENEQWMLLVLLLDEIRKQKGITHQDIEDNSDLLRSNITRFFSLKFKPTLPVFLKIAKCIDVNFFLEDKEGKSDLNQAFENAMEKLGRRADKLPKN